MPRPKKPKRFRSLTEAQDLRDLAAQIEDLCREHQARSLAGAAVAALVDYLRLRARLMELSASA